MLLRAISLTLGSTKNEVKTPSFGTQNDITLAQELGTTKQIREYSFVRAEARAVPHARETSDVKTNVRCFPFFFSIESENC